MREIERKFLVTDPKFFEKGNLVDRLQIIQGYLTKEEGKVIRVRNTFSERDKINSGFLTIKLKFEDDTAPGVDEFEYEIPSVEAANLIYACGEKVLHKTRHEIEVGKTLWEVDVFYGKHAGLIVAEVEVENITDAIDKPEWLGIEVTGDAKYANANMV